jgi:bifunctional DNA-binding transcriptional regulator/antitoxin component of YhaV-PrlF toxin-antitoxin module
MGSAAETFRIKVAARRQVTLPRELMELLRIDEGDALEICVEKNLISGGCGLKLVPTSLFDERLVVQLREREKEIASGSGIAATDKADLVRIL